MLRFRDIWKYTDRIPGSFTQLSGEHYFEQAMACRDTMVEIGVDQGRSASILLAVSRETGVSVILIDNWRSVLIDNYDKVRRMCGQDFRGVDVKILHMDSEDGGTELDRLKITDLGLVHIDADHYEAAPATDCEVWLPKLVKGGVACFHDYGATFPAVTEAVDKYTEGWESLGNWDGLAIRRKP